MSTTSTRCSGIRTCSTEERKQAALARHAGHRDPEDPLHSAERSGTSGDQVGGLPPKQKFGVYVKLTNSEKQGLGQPLPKGVVRVYKADKGGSRQFVGEDAIDHTPRDEEIEDRARRGLRRDPLDRKQMTWRALGSCGSESTGRSRVTNAKDAVKEVEIVGAGERRLGGRRQ